MKRFVIAATLMLAAGSAYADNIKIVNESGLPIDELYASQPGKKAWGPNLLDGVPEGALDNGKSYAVAGLSDGTYDLRIEAPDEGVSCVIKAVPIKKGQAKLDAKLGKACK